MSSYDLTLTDEGAGQTMTTGVAGTSWTPSQSLNPGDIYMWSLGAISASSEFISTKPLTFTIAPTANRLSGVIATLQPTFTWNEVIGATDYQVWLVDQTTNQIINPIVTGASWTPSQPLNVGDQYVWAVGAMDGGPHIGWSSVQSFTIAPTGSGPSGVIATLQPTFSWNTVAGVANYQVKLVDESTNQIINPIVTGASWVPSQPLNPGQNYIWSVGAIGGNSQIGWDSPLTFTIAPTAIGPSGPVTTLLPTFTWNAVAGATNYQFWLVDQTIHQTVNPIVTGVSWTPSQPLNPGDNYIWWVGAIVRQWPDWLGQPPDVHDRPDGNRSERPHHDPAADLLLERRGRGGHLSSLVG